MAGSVEEKTARAGEAGHSGKDVRSDLHVVVEARDGGGLEITMESRVAPYYGSSILTQARQVLETLGVKHARVAIHDEGALPFVISARIEAAAKRARVGAGTEGFTGADHFAGAVAPRSHAPVAAVSSRVGA